MQEGNAEVISALIGILGSVLGVIASLPLMTWRINQLEKKVDKHNNTIERTYRLEQDINYMKEDVKVIKKDMEELKYARKNCETN